MEDAKTRTNMTGCNRAASIKYLLFVMLVLTGRTALGAPAPMQVGGNLSGLEILDTASSTVAALSSYILQIDTTATVTSPQLTPETITVTDFHGVWFQKPYNLYWYGKAGSASVGHVCNGTQFLTFFPAANQYVLEPFSADQYDKTLYASVRGISDVLPYFLTPGLGSFLRGQFENVQVAGPEMVNGISCYRIDFARRNLGASSVWVSAAQPHLPIKIQQRPAVTDSTSGAAAGQEALLKWTVEKPLQADLFAIKPPENANPISLLNFKFLQPAWERGTQQCDMRVAQKLRIAAAVEARHVASGGSLVGRSAPDFTLPTLSGKPVSLGSLRGKVVILDFFATWCGPCRASMPGVENLAKQYSGQGVELIALNQGESATKVRSFLSSVGISPRVALDAQAGVGERYGVSGIPHLVMIDRQGIVRVAQSGLPQDSKRYLEPHLQKLLAQ